MRLDILKAIDAIDAALFTGDEFTYWEDREELASFVARWEREIERLRNTYEGEA